MKGKDELVLRRWWTEATSSKPRKCWYRRTAGPLEAALVEHFKESRDRTLDYVRTTQDDLRDHFFEHPVFKTVDAYQFILMMSAHCQRHTMQLNEVKQAAGFPK